MQRVALFASCLIDQFYPHIAYQVVNVLERLGFEVIVPENQTCCGQPAFNSGYPDEARSVLQAALDCLRDADVDAIIVPSGSCASMLKVFSRELTKPDPVTDRIFEFSQFVAKHGGAAKLNAAFTMSAVYHDSCHQLRALCESESPRELLRSVKGLQLLELPEAVCCGFGGTFSVKMPDISLAMRSDKIDAIVASGAQAVVSTDMGCLIHINAGLRDRQSDIQTLHIAEVLSRR